MDNQTTHNNIDSIEDLRRQWQAMNVRVDDLETRNRDLVSRLNDNRICGLRRKLMRHRMRSMILCFILPFLFTPVLIGSLGVSWWFAAIYILFFLVMGCVNGCIWRSLSKMDTSSATTEEALLHVYNVQRYVRYGRLVGWSLAIPVLVWLFSIFYNIGDPGVIWGGWAGLLLGLAIGICADYRQRKLLRQLRLEIEMSDDTPL